MEELLGLLLRVLNAIQKIYFDFSLLLFIEEKEKPLLLIFFPLFFLRKADNITGQIYGPMEELH